MHHKTQRENSYKRRTDPANMSPHHGAFDLDPFGLNSRADRTPPVIWIYSIVWDMRRDVTRARSNSAQLGFRSVLFDGTR
ncbi:hypothetical protein V1477_001617 [Vespula maculifrons]|uniref:Uncharacterized protein n=1 Tax=Vespula maculifrons TaxID=7453 RepID=A0ABD2CYL9_VESMC